MIIYVLFNSTNKSNSFKQRNKKKEKNKRNEEVDNFNGFFSLKSLVHPRESKIVLGSLQYTMHKH